MNATTFTAFTTTAPDSLGLGSDALLYVMAHGHTISVPTDALRFAEKVGIMSIARRDTPAPVLADVNKALDIIAPSVRYREQLDREEAARSAERLERLTRFADSTEPKSGGARVPVTRPQPIIPPSTSALRF